MKKTIKFAATIRTEDYEPEVTELLLHISKYMIEEGEDPQEWVNGTFVSDESCIGDFLSRDKDLESLADELNLFDLNRSDRVCDIAHTLRQMKTRN